MLMQLFFIITQGVVEGIKRCLYIVVHLRGKRIGGKCLMKLGSAQERDLMLLLLLVKFFSRHYLAYNKNSGKSGYTYTTKVCTCYRISAQNANQSGNDPGQPNCKAILLTSFIFINVMLNYLFFNIEAVLRLVFRHR